MDGPSSKIPNPPVPKILPMNPTKQVVHFVYEEGVNDEGNESNR